MKFRKSRCLSNKKTDQRGFTLLELTVTMSVMSVGILGLLRVSLAGMTVSMGANARTTATAVAASEIEALRAIPYADLGFTPSAVGFRASFEGATTVVVPEAVVQVEPTGVLEQDGLSFSVTRDIVWASALVGEGPVVADTAYKRTIVEVSWTDQQGPHHIRQDSGVYPGGLGTYGAAITTTTIPATIVPGAPLNLAAALGADPSSQINLTWTQGTPESTSWTLQQSSDNGTSWTTLTSTQPGSTTNFSVSGLAQSTTYTFRVQGMLGTQISAWSTSAAATTSSASGLCTSLSGSATPSTVKRNPSKYLVEGVQVTVNTNGGCSYGLRLKFYSGSGSVPTPFAMTQQGSVFKYTINKNDYKWTTGAKTLEILDPSGNVITEISLLVVDG